MQQSTITTFQSYSNFKSIKHFNDNVQAFLFEHKKAFPSAQLHCLKALSRFACKVVGVSNISISKLLKSLSDKGIKVSESTFHRMKRTAIKLGILKSIPLQRTNGSSSSNLWVFQLWLNNDTLPKNKKQEQITDKSTISEKGTDTPIKLSRSKTSDLLNKRIEQRNHESNILPDWIKNKFPELVKTASYYFKSCEISEFAKCATILSKRFKLCSDKVKSLSVEALEQMVLRMKGKKIHNIFGYYWGILAKKMKASHLNSLFETVFDTGCGDNQHTYKMSVCTKEYVKLRNAIG
ncbi:hypothetical protein [Rossellomorea sp. BNER]|uniref:hypothetical protein n=1 Tax=Rossellomorea sp. BNER TaxID=2962031 RepID=UPI003AF24C7D|nr:hypothetical protein [Rossellomorea sp. BNER]